MNMCDVVSLGILLRAQLWPHKEPPLDGLKKQRRAIALNTESVA